MNMAWGKTKLMEIENYQKKNLKLYAKSLK